MKKTLYIAAAVFSLLAVSCAKELEGNKINEGIIAHASLQPVEATKAVGQYSYNIVWEANDKIAVLDNANNKTSFSLKEGAGSTSGTFQQEGTDVLTAPLTAYYPASVVADDKSLVWPAIQTDVNDITNAIKAAKKGDMPSVVIIDSILGKDTEAEGTNKAHAKQLSEDEIKSLKERYKLSLEPFDYDEESLSYVTNTIATRMEKKYENWQLEYNRIKETGNTEIIKMRLDFFIILLLINFIKIQYSCSSVRNDPCRGRHSYLRSDHN